jgi:hypothetical protein
MISGQTGAIKPLFLIDEEEKQFLLLFALLAERLPETIFQGGVQMKKLDMFEKDILSDYEGGEFTPPLLQKKSWKNLKLLLLPHSLKKSGSISAFPPQT